MFIELLNFLIKLDKELFLFINLKLQNGFFDFLMPILTEFKYWRIPFILIILVMLIFGKKKERIVAILILIILGITDASVNFWLKPWIGRVRPCNIFQQVHLLAGCSHSGSFPSSHSANIFGAGMILTFFYRRAWIIWLSIALLVSFSRIYVGVHYPLDVMAGVFYGILWGVLILFIITYKFKYKTIDENA
ncbi:MAG: phosphatase PAP2 family protein [Candidatus Zixiibacteriota bacterium]